MCESFRIAINQDLKALYPNHKVNQNFLHHWFKFKEQVLISMASGSTVKGIRLETIRLIKINLPPLPEQKKIADILNSMDKSIEEKQRKLEQTKSLKKALMNDLLTGKVRVAA